MKFFQIVPKQTNINFISKFKYFIVFSVASVSLVIYGLIFTKGLNFGVDFTGGTVLQVKFNPSITDELLRKHLSELGETEATVVGLGEKGDEYLITARMAMEAKNESSLKTKLTDKVGADKMTVLSADVVGPKVGADLKMAAIRSLFYSVILITIYIWLRFDIRFAPGATIAMVHDLFMATGLYLLTGREFTITAVAALLTIAGYSVNDTIVIYDRVREMIRGGTISKGTSLADTINKAINLTLSRTLLTALVTLISLVPIIFLCTGEIQSFAIAMCFGIFVGVYSTMYIASPFTIYVEKFLENKNKKQAKTAAA